MLSSDGGRHRTYVRKLTEEGRVTTIELRRGWMAVVYVSVRVAVSTERRGSSISSGFTDLTRVTTLFVGSVLISRSTSKEKRTY